MDEWEVKMLRICDENAPVKLVEMCKKVKVDFDKSLDATCGIFHFF